MTDLLWDLVVDNPVAAANDAADLPQATVESFADIPEPEAVDIPILEPPPLALFGFDLFGDPVKPKPSGRLKEQFLVPPFSVLDARQGYWQQRKRAWIDLGIESELGRGPGVWVESSETGSPTDRQQGYKNAAPGGSMLPAADYSTRARGDGRGRRVDGNKLGFSASATIKRHGVGFDGYAVLRGEVEAPSEPSGTSIFDPVVCELAYRWFSPVDGVVLDPFAGGSVRGIVASLLGRSYIGVDLSARQVEANRVQAEALCGSSPTPVWIVGDSSTADYGVPNGVDLVFSCPPYGDLEVYSDHPSDLSSMSHEKFLQCYAAIIARVVASLKPDRFACFVVGDYRDKYGHYRNFVSNTIAAFEVAGCRLYNEAILVTQVGSLSIRVQKQFTASRKLGKTHQNLLCFVKGDARKAAAACGTVEV